jgi:threonylcarbamoyladenosine tRNA methylthiotransferase MtaB
MTDFSVDFLGCKISHTDAERIREALLDAGHADTPDAGSIQVINACCITAEAEAKSRKAVRRRLARGEDVQVFVTGCGANLHAEQYSELGDRVTVLSGAAELAVGRIVEAADRLAGLGCKGTTTSATAQRTRAFVKIQDGCDFLCSYCIVPTVRGGSRSRLVNDVLRDVARRVARGQREIVLTGVNIGLYRDPESRIGLHQLVTAVANTPGVIRVRISSIEVNHVNRRLVEAMARHPKICRHLHVPMQSGDDRVLTEMRRNYDSARYIAAIDRARAAMPDLNLTADVIVGFPTEDEAAFQNTLAVCERVGVTKVHAFPFSPRPGTEEGNSDPISLEVKRDRSQRLREAADARARRHWQQRIGSSDRVLVERSGRGYTADYSPTSIVSAETSGTLVDVRIVSVSADGLIAEVVR